MGWVSGLKVQDSWVEGGFRGLGEGREGCLGRGFMARGSGFRDNSGVSRSRIQGLGYRFEDWVEGREGRGGGSGESVR